MKSLSKTILAIAPGKREFGIAVFNGIELAHFSLRTVKSKRSKKLLKTEIVEMMQECITTFQPQVIAIKTISQYQQKSMILKSILRIVERQAEACKIPWIGISTNQVKAMLSNDEKSTQRKAFENLTIFYPELRQFTDRPNKWQNEYYHNLFSAVSVGLVVLRSLSKST